jgi:hypothetical protein
MKKIILILILSTYLFSCDEKRVGYPQGDPIIVKKRVSMVPGYCIYTYEGWGRIQDFEDKCCKYSIGDRIYTKDE